MDTEDTSGESPGGCIEPPSLGAPATLDLEDQHCLLDDASRGLLTRCAEGAVRQLAVGGEVRVSLIDDETMAGMHARHLDLSGPTDVLTFDMSADDSDTLDTDIYICVPEASRQAAANGIPVWREVLLYIVHGALHCLGHDDHDEASSRAMHRREDEILEAIGVGATYIPAIRGEAHEDLAVESRPGLNA